MSQDYPGDAASDFADAWQCIANLHSISGAIRALAGRCVQTELAHLEAAEREAAEDWARSSQSCSQAVPDKSLNPRGDYQDAGRPDQPRNHAPNPQQSDAARPTQVATKHPHDPELDNTDMPACGGIPASECGPCSPAEHILSKVHNTTNHARAPVAHVMGFSEDIVSVGNHGLSSTTSTKAGDITPTPTTATSHPAHTHLLVIQGTGPSPSLAQGSHHSPHHESASVPSSTSTTTSAQQWSRSPSSPPGEHSALPSSPLPRPARRTWGGDPTPQQDAAPPRHAATEHDTSQWMPQFVNLPTKRPPSPPPTDQPDHNTPLVQQPSTNQLDSHATGSSAATGWQGADASSGLAAGTKGPVMESPPPADWPPSVSSMTSTLGLSPGMHHLGQWPADGSATRIATATRLFVEDEGEGDTTPEGVTTRKVLWREEVAGEMVSAGSNVGQKGRAGNRPMSGSNSNSGSAHVHVPQQTVLQGLRREVPGHPVRGMGSNDSKGVDPGAVTGVKVSQQQLGEGRGKVSGGGSASGLIRSGCIQACLTGGGGVHKVQPAMNVLGGIPSGGVGFGGARSGSRVSGAGYDHSVQGLGQQEDGVGEMDAMGWVRVAGQQRHAGSGLVKGREWAMGGFQRWERGDGDDDVNSDSGSNSSHGSGWETVAGGSHSDDEQREGGSCSGGEGDDEGFDERGHHRVGCGEQGWHRAGAHTSSHTEQIHTRSRHAGVIPGPIQPPWQPTGRAQPSAAVLERIAVQTSATSASGAGGAGASGLCVSGVGLRHRWSDQGESVGMHGAARHPPGQWQPAPPSGPAPTGRMAAAGTGATAAPGYTDVDSWLRVHSIPHVRPTPPSHVASKHHQAQPHVAGQKLPPVQPPPTMDERVQRTTRVRPTPMHVPLQSSSSSSTAAMHAPLPRTSILFPPPSVGQSVSSRLPSLSQQSSAAMPTTTTQGADLYTNPGLAGTGAARAWGHPQSMGDTGGGGGGARGLISAGMAGRVPAAATLPSEELFHAIKKQLASLQATFVSASMQGSGTGSGRE